jgi:hypothetical protein
MTEIPSIVPFEKMGNTKSLRPIFRNDHNGDGQGHVKPFLHPVLRG